ncbi:pimeloyl-ACP methyl ester carboxylesterase [Streptomyces sp. V4I2]|nr:pimeloyl-ACP methyl ester carboxylesterase [Streptomyces sp. V4I2]
MACHARDVDAGSVIRYDHRGTGRSTWAYDRRPQLLIADHPDGLLSGTLIGTSALSTVPYIQPGGSRTARGTPGDQLPFDAECARALERKVIAHTGHHTAGTAHTCADASYRDRTEQLAPAIHGAHIVDIPGMGHALPLRHPLGP